MPSADSRYWNPEMESMLGRVDDMLKVKGVIVYPAAIDGVISSFIPRVTGDFRIRLEEKPPRVVPPPKLRIERGPQTSLSALAEFGGEIEGAMHERLKFTPRIVWLEPGELPRSEHKTRFIEIVPPGQAAGGQDVPR